MQIKKRENGTTHPTSRVELSAKICFDPIDYGHAPHNDVSVSGGPHNDDGPIRLYYNIILQYHCVTVAYSIQYSNTLYRFVAYEQ
jgi:hypothetical protein